MIYVCSPFRGNIDENVKFAKACCGKILSKGNVPITPHLYFPQFMDDSNETERNLALEMNKKLIDVCDVVFVYGSMISEGMKFEIDYATLIGKDVLYFGD